MNGAIWQLDPRLMWSLLLFSMVASLLVLLVGCFYMEVTE